MKYYIRLDALRFFAVLLVIFHHWLPRNHFINTMPTGAIGVTIFFVLSGFLISNILFAYKEKVQEGKITFTKALKTFFIRRSLRIFPIYFLFIFFLLMIGFPSIKENILYFLTYTSNILIFQEQSFIGNVSHLWTLAVEEQFYLLWPILIFLISERSVVKVIIFLIFISVASQYAMRFNYSIYGVLVLNVMDAFGLGALLAYVKRYKSSDLYLLKILLACFLIFIIVFNSFLFSFFPLQIQICLGTVLLLIYLTSERNNLFLKIFDFIPFIYIGKISYGIYLYHTFVPVTLNKVYVFLGVLDKLNLFLVFCLDFFFLIVLSSLSWYLIENPINGIKKKFSVQKQNQTFSLVEPEELSN